MLEMSIIMPSDMYDSEATETWRFTNFVLYCIVSTRRQLLL